MSQKLQVIFQSKVKDGIECGPETILLHNSDMKQLKVKSGSLVVVEMNQISLYCRAWPSKKSTQGVAMINKIWMPNLSTEQRHVVVSNANNYRCYVV